MYRNPSQNHPLERNPSSAFSFPSAKDPWPERLNAVKAVLHAGVPFIHGTKEKH
jgi:hypothetical protein